MRVTGLGALNLSLFGGVGQLPARQPIQEMDLSGLLTPGTGALDSIAPRTPARMTPWDQNAPQTPADQLVREAMNSRFLVSDSLGTGPGSATRDRNDRELFILHNAVNKLKALADRAASSGMSASDRTRFGERIQRGIDEIMKRAADTRLDGAILMPGKRLINHTSESLTRSRAEFDTRVLTTGAASAVPEAFLGDRRFSISITREGVTRTVEVNLADLGSAPRSMEAVSGLINTRLADAGVESRVNRVETSRPGTGTNAPAVTEQRFRVVVATGERIAFNPAPDDTVPALTVAGGRTVNGAAQGAIMRLDEPAGTSATQTFSTDITATGGTATVRAMVRDAAGNSFVIADATGRVGAVTPKSSRDVVLQKIDSTGQVVWTRALGSAAAAQGFSLAIGPDGQLAVAGAVDGRADQARTTTGSGRDSFVAAFDREGRDLWYHQQGALGSDQADHVAFGADGRLFVAGRTASGMAGQEGSGDGDVFVQAFDPAGALSWTRVLGGTGTDEPAGLVVNGGVPVVAWNGAAGARLTALDPLDGASFASGLATADTGLSAITALAVGTGGQLVLAGRAATGGDADQLRVLDPTSGALSLSASTGGQSIRSLTTGNGQIAVALGAPIGEGGTFDTSRTIVRGLSQTDGSQTFQVTARVAAGSPVALALDSGNGRSLGALGLPQGELLFGDADRLTDRTALRPGDHFFVRVNGGREARIEIAEGETFRSLASKVNRVLLRDGRAEARSARGTDSLVITPSAGDRIELRAGAQGQDVLRQLGLEPGVAMPRSPSSTATRSVSDPPPVVALDIPARGDVATAASAKTLASDLDGVLRRIRMGYREISTDPSQVELRRTLSQSRPTAASQASIQAYNRQTALAQDALRRLGG